MQREEIYSKIKEIISATFKGEISLDNVNENTDLIEDLGINSIVGIEVLVRVEDEFGIQIDDEDLTVELLKNMSSLADYIEGRLSEK